MFACSGGEPYLLLCGGGAILFIGLVAFAYCCFVRAVNEWSQAQQRLDERRESERLWREYGAE